MPTPVLAVALSLGVARPAHQSLVASRLTPFKGSFSVYSDPVHLRFGEVANKVVCNNSTGCALPSDVIARYASTTGRQMAISGVSHDIVRIAADGTETSVPLYDIYDHHASVMIAGEDPSNMSLPLLSWGLPFWSRATPHNFPGTFRETMKFTPSKWLMSFHIINTHKPGLTTDELLSTMVDGHPLPLHLSQCPCSPQRQIDLVNNTIDGNPFPPCRFMLRDVDNAVCSLATYTGGQECCDTDGMFITDTAAECKTPTCDDLPADTVYFKATVQYEDALANHTLDMNIFYDGVPMNADNPGNPLINANAMELGMHLSVGTGVHTNDYLVPACAKGTPPAECTHTLSWEEPLKGMTPNAIGITINASLPYQVIQAYPHVHAGVISTKIEDALTNITLCYASVANGKIIMGTGTEAGNEKGYLVGQKSCDFGDFSQIDGADIAPHVQAGQPLRITTVYNNSVPQLGVMSAWFLMVAQIPSLEGMPCLKCGSGK